jgi:hypothetical protein
MEGDEVSRRRTIEHLPVLKGKPSTDKERQSLIRVALLICKCYICEPTDSVVSQGGSPDVTVYLVTTLNFYALFMLVLNDLMSDDVVRDTCNLNT